MHAALIAPDPPLAFEDASFDLAWSISVFTHLTDNSLAWLLELHRVLNVKQTQRELDFGRRIIRALEQRHADELDAVRRECERSLSWRLTRPLREGLNAARRRRAGRPS